MKSFMIAECTGAPDSLATIQWDGESLMGYSSALGRIKER